MIVLHFHDFILPFILKRQKISKTVENNNFVFHATKLKLGLKSIFLNFYPENKKIASTKTEKKCFNHFLVCKHPKGGPNTQRCFLEISVFFLV